MEDDMFLDDDLDDIPDNTLLELEQNAISSTQRQKVSQAPPPAVNLRKQAHNASSLYRSQNSTKNLAWRPPRRQQPGMPTASQARSAGPNEPAPTSSDEYGFDEENVIDLDEPSMVIHPASGPAARPRPTSRTASRSIDPETAAAFAAADAEMGAGAQQWDHAPHLQHKPRNDSETAKLMARIAQLEAEQTRLQRLEQEARRAAATKQGEISIVRAKEEKAAKEYERRLSVMQKLHADEAAKQKAELEAMRKQREKMETDNRFLQHDLAQEADRVKRTVGSSKMKQTKEKETPRKRKQGHGDGFNDSEVLMVSPSRSRERSKDQTPTAGTKRKRSAQDSPLPALSFMPPPKPSREVSGEQLVSPDILLNVESNSTDAREQHEFLQRMLNHKRAGSGDRTIELFTKHNFPSNPARSLASIYFDGVSSPLRRPGTDYMPLKVSYTLLGLWSSCLHEKTYEPLALVIDMLRAALYFELSSHVSKLVEDAVPICLQSIDLVVTPAIQSQHASFSATFDHKAQDDMASKVDVDEVVEFLHFINQSAALSPERLETFWQHIHFKGSLLMLNKVQPLPRIIQALQILSTSILDATFGAISSDSSQQEQQEQTTVDRLATWLFETPRAPKGENSYTDEELAELRMETLSIFKKMCLTDHGGQLLAKHRFAIAKLVKFLHVQVGKLYRIRPHTCRHRRSSSSEDEDQQPSLHDLTITNINTTVRVLHHILRTFDESIDLTSKLEVERGGYHAFLISMSRVAFSEQLVFEAGIETEVVEAAHDILDNVLSPEEGEAIVKAVETPRGTRSTTTRRDPSGESQDDTMQIDDDDEDDE
jgi:hypothetical protein